MSVEINTDEVIRVGRDLYPGLAAKYRVIAEILGSAQNDHGADALNGSSFLSEWAMYNAHIGLTLEVSGRHLDDCGRTLVAVAEDHAWTDEQNAYKIEEAYTGSIEDELAPKFPGLGFGERS